MVANNSEPTFVSSLLSQLIRVKSSLQQAWLLSRRVKVGRINTYIGHFLLKNIYPESVKMIVESEWDEAKKNITQE